MNATVPQRVPSEDKVALHIDRKRLRLSGWAAGALTSGPINELILSLMLGPTLLGTIRRDRERPEIEAELGHPAPGAGFQVDEFGLGAFARLTGVGEPALVATTADGSSVECTIPLQDVGGPDAEPLGSRNGIRKSVRMVDVWFESARNIALRFEGGGRSNKRLDAYQRGSGLEPHLVQLAADQRLGSAATVSIALINPLTPLLLVFRGEDGAIDAIDILPFPSLARGGLHSAERLMTGRSSESLVDLARLSCELLEGMIDRLRRPKSYVTGLELDPAVQTGLEPVVNEDMLAWLGEFLGLSVVAGDRSEELPPFIAQRIAAHAPRSRHFGPVLVLPADAIPTISALANPIPNSPEARTVSGAFGVVDWNRHGNIWSVWQPSLSNSLEVFQHGGGPRLGPALRLPARPNAKTSKQDVALSWPLAIAIRQRPTKFALTGPFETASELPLPITRNKVVTEPSRAQAIVLFDNAFTSPLPLLQTLAQQQSIGELSVTVCWPVGENPQGLEHALKTLFPKRHLIVPQPRHWSRLEQLAPVLRKTEAEDLFIAGAQTILPDVRTLSTLFELLSHPDVATAGCLVRGGDREMTPLAAGYALSGLNLLGTPTLSFDPIDPSVFRQPATYPVIANSSAALAAKRSHLLDLELDACVSAVPGVGDLTLGLHVLERGCFNLCTTLVSVVSSAAPRGGARSVSLGYSLRPDALERIARSATLVQRLQ